MRSNGLLKWLMIPVALLVLFVGIRLFSGGGSTAPPAADNGAQLTPEEMKALGIEGDTPRDTVATLVAQVKQLRTELQTALSDNKSQREENQRLRQRENSIDQRINSALESERSNLRRDQSRRPARASRPKGCSPTCSGAWTASAGAAAAMPTCPWAWGCRAATRPAWKAACAGSNRTTRSPPRGATGGVARAAA
jgi:integrating conjugative element protein (TIGR03752 family)